MEILLRRDRLYSPDFSVFALRCFFFAADTTGNCAGQYENGILVGPMCECLIHRRLCGIPDIEKATRVEHFCQPSHLVHIRIEDLLESQQAGGDRNDLRASKASGRLTEGPTNRVA